MTVRFRMQSTERTTVDRNSNCVLLYLGRDDIRTFWSIQTSKLHHWSGSSARVTPIGSERAAARFMIRCRYSTGLSLSPYSLTVLCIVATHAFQGGTNSTELIAILEKRSGHKIRALEIGIFICSHFCYPGLDWTARSPFWKRAIRK